MGSRLKFIIAMLFILATTIASAREDKMVQDASVLPVKSREFLLEHFKDIPISHIHIEKDFILVDCYDVILTDGTNIEFDSSGRWTEVKRHNSSLPESVIPPAMLESVRKNYPSSMIVVIERESKGYELKLDNELEIKYDLKGNILKID